MTTRLDEGVEEGRVGRSTTGTQTHLSHSRSLSVHHHITLALFFCCLPTREWITARRKKNRDTHGQALGNLLYCCFFLVTLGNSQHKFNKHTQTHAHNNEENVYTYTEAHSYRRAVAALCSVFVLSLAQQKKKHTIFTRHFFSILHTCDGNLASKLVSLVMPFPVRFSCRLHTGGNQFHHQQSHSENATM